jgi:hypothetical protein
VRTMLAHAAHCNRVAGWIRVDHGDTARPCTDVRRGVARHSGRGSKGAVMFKPTHSSTCAIRRRREPVVISRCTSGFSAVTGTGRDAELPEWLTEAWKHRVEAEACRRLTRNIRGAGAAR